MLTKLVEVGVRCFDRFGVSKTIVAIWVRDSRSVLGVRRVEFSPKTSRLQSPVDLPDAPAHVVFTPCANKLHGQLALRASGPARSEVKQVPANVSAIVSPRCMLQPIRFVLGQGLETLAAIRAIRRNEELVRLKISRSVERSKPDLVQGPFMVESLFPEYIVLNGLNGNNL